METIQRKEHKNIRRLAMKALVDINRDKKYANIVLPHYIMQEKLEDLDRRFFTELVYGVVRRQNYLDAIIEHLTKKPVKRVSPLVLEILRLGIYQLIYMDKVPSSAAVNESVKLAKKVAPGMDRFINAVLRNVDRKREEISIDSLASSEAERISFIYNQPLWLVNLWIQQRGVEETSDVCEWFNETPLLTARVNTLKISREALLEELTEAGWNVEPSHMIPEAIIVHSHKGQLQQAKWVQQGALTFMDEASMAVAYAMDPKEGMHILDICAAPGGKTLHMSTLMKNTGSIVATDIHEHKVNLLEENAKRMGATNVTAQQGDATAFHEAWKAQYDAVLVDAPCSGLGILQKKLDMRWRKDASQLTSLPELQLQILENASSYVKIGGYLVYSTCTINELENEHVIQAFLDKHANYSLEDVAPLLPFATEGPMVTLLPHVYDMDGFFIARLRKEKE